MAKPTQTINFLGINQPDKEVHFRYSHRNSESDHRHNIQQRYVAPKAHTNHKLLGTNQPDKEVHLERPQTQHSAKGTWHQIRPQYQIRGKA